MGVNAANIQSVRYPGLQPPSTASQALLGAVSGASGFLQGRNEAQATQAQQQATARNAVLGPLINQGQLGVVPPGGQGGFEAFPGSNIRLQQQTPTGDALDPLQLSRKRQIDLKIGDVQSDEFDKIRAIDDIDTRLLTDRRYRRLMFGTAEFPATAQSKARGAKYRQTLIEASLDLIDKDPPKAKVKEREPDFFDKAVKAVELSSPAANVFKLFNARLPKPEQVDQIDWDKAGDEEKRNLIEALGL